MKKVLLDTNITISALFWDGNPRKVYDLAGHGKLITLLSDDIEAVLERKTIHNASGDPRRFR